MSRSTISTFQLFAAFPDEETARTYLEGRLWANGVKCPECKGSRVGTRPGGFYRCPPCGIDFTVRTGTILERSHVPLHKWMRCLILLMNDPFVTVDTVAKETGITAKSAWRAMALLRQAAGRLLPSGEGAMNMPCLDYIVDVVLRSTVKPKTKAAKRRKRRAQNAKRKRR